MIHYFAAPSALTLARLSRLALFALFSILVMTGTASAQFGKNKVQYKNFDWKVLQTEHFDIYFYEKERDMVLDAARLSERAYMRYSRMLNFVHRRRIPLILYASHNDFQQTNVLPGDISEGLAGVNEFVKKRVLLPFTGSWKDFEHTLTHELAHAFQIDILWGDTTPLANPFAYSPPLWFIEGMVEQLSMDRMTPGTEMWLRDAALSGYLMTLDELSYMPDLRSYRFGHSVWYFISQRYGNKKIGEILQKTPVFGNVGRSFKSAIGADLKTLSQQWTEDIRKTYLPQIVNFQKPEDFSRRLTRHGADGSSYNVAPALNSTGERLAYISNKDGYIDIWNASAVDGKDREKLVEGQRNPDFESFRFLYTSLNWSRDDRYITFVAKSGPEEAVYVYATYNNKVVNRFKFGMDGILSPAFSPDGKKIVFCGLNGGRSNLYTVEVETGKLEQLTDDKYTQRDPVYSPDGKKIAFVTEYGPGTDLDRLIFADYRIGLLDVETGEYSILPNSYMDNISPQWSPDGSKLAYVSDRTGIPNVFYHDFNNGREYQVTDILTGVAGPTETSPCISWSAGSGRLAYSAFFEAGWDIFVLNSPESMAREWIPDTTRQFAYETIHLNAEKARIAELREEFEKLGNRGKSVSREAGVSRPDTLLADSRMMHNPASREMFGENKPKTQSEGPTPDMIDIDPPKPKEPLMLDSLSKQGNRLNGEWKEDLLAGIQDSLQLLDSLGRADSLARAQNHRKRLAISALDTLSLFQLMHSGDSTLLAALGLDPMDLIGMDSAAVDQDSLLQVLVPDSTLAAGSDSTDEEGLPPISFDFDVPKENIPLPDTSSFKVKRYKSKFSVDYVTGYGGYQGNYGVNGGVLASFSDVLNNHNMQIGANIYGKIQDSDILFQYMYLKPRTNVGFYVTQFRDLYLSSIASFDGEYFANIWRGAGLLFSRPFDRFRRFEWALNAYSVSSKTYSLGFFSDPFSYNGYGTRLEDGQNFGTVYFAGPEAALVFDNTAYGYTGPVDGARYRLGVRQFWGELSYTELLADWRKYLLFWQRITVAGRVIAGTRMGNDPQTFYVGGPYTFRGAGWGDVRGNNLLLGNFELRFPLIEHLVMGPLPIYLRGIGGVLFFDLGAAWFNDESFQPFTSTNTSLFKFKNAQAAYGFGIRMNLGYFIVKLDFAKSLDHYQDAYYLYDNKIYKANERIKGRNRNYFSIGPDF